MINHYINLVKNKNLDLPEMTGELKDNSRNFILPGVYSTRLYLKQANAKSSWLLNKLAEPFHSHLEVYGIAPNRRKELSIRVGIVA
ncbi:MAG: hypothetical protein MZU97_06215 [Bacillus subtilis]|nr:hypothetical protein [Bacillus subtilis]